MGAVVGNSFWFDFEVSFMEWLQNVLGNVGTTIISQFSLFGEEMVLILLLGFLYWCYDKEMGEFVGLSILIGLVSNPLLKNIFWRRRPYFDHENIKCLRPVEKDADIYDIAAQGFSFPSGHSTNAVSTYTALAVRGKNKALTTIAILAPILIGLSRMTVGVHYPTDVFCGWLLGGISTILAVLIFKKFSSEKRWIIYLIIFLISCLGLLYCKTSDYFGSLGLMGGIFGAFEFEKRYVHFEPTRKPLVCIIRIAIGVGIYLALNTVLKMPFSSEFLSSGTFAAGLVRVVRYLIVSFVTVGVYPMTFKLYGKNEK